MFKFWLFLFFSAAVSFGTAHASSSAKFNFTDPNGGKTSSFNILIDKALENFGYKAVQMDGSTKSGFALQWLNRIYLEQGESARGRVFIKGSVKTPGFESGKIYELEANAYVASFRTASEGDYLVYFSGMRRSLVEDLGRAIEKSLGLKHARLHFWRISPLTEARAEGKNYYCSGETPTNAIFSTALGILRNGGACIHDIGVGVWQSTGGFARSVVHGAMNVGETWEKIKAETAAFGNFFANFQESFAEFKTQIASLPWETQAKILCELAGNIGAGALIAALTSGLGGSTLATGLAAAVTRISKMTELAGSKSLVSIAEKLEVRAAKSRLAERADNIRNPPGPINREDVVVGVKTLGVATCNDIATVRGTRSGFGADLPQQEEIAAPASSK